MCWWHLHREGNPPATRKNPNLKTMKVRFINGVRVIDRGCSNAPRSSSNECMQNDNAEFEINRSSQQKEASRKSRRKTKKPDEDSNQCLYCQRLFSSQKGLSQHIPHCKVRNVLPHSNQVERVPCTKCHRTFAGEIGLKIHHSKSKCGKNESLDTNCLPQDSESEALTCQENNHSAPVTPTNIKRVKYPQ